MKSMDALVLKNKRGKAAQGCEVTVQVHGSAFKSLLKADTTVKFHLAQSIFSVCFDKALASGDVVSVKVNATHTEAFVVVGFAKHLQQKPASGLDKVLGGSWFAILGKVGVCVCFMLCGGVILHTTVVGRWQRNGNHCDCVSHVKRAL